MKVAQDYSTLSKAIGIHILNFTSIPKAKDYHNVFHITEKNEGFTYFEDLELHTIELNKFTDNPNEDLPSIVAKVKTSLDMWSTFLTRNDLLKADALPKELNDVSLKKAIAVLEVMNFSEEERDFYEDHLKWLRVETNSLKKMRAEGKTEGLAEGKAEENIRLKTEIAKKMASKNHSISDITDLTGLSLEKISKLR